MTCKGCGAALDRATTTCAACGAPTPFTALAGLVGLALVDWRTVPPTAGTCAFILTLAALGVAIYRR